MLVLITVNQWRSLTVFYRFSKRCWLFSQNSTECNSKNYGKKLPFYGRTMEQNSELYFVSYCIYQSAWKHHQTLQRMCLNHAWPGVLILTLKNQQSHSWVIIHTSDVLEHKWRASLTTILFLYEWFWLLTLKLLKIRSSFLISHTRLRDFSAIVTTLCNAWIEGKKQQQNNTRYLKVFFVIFYS